MPKKLDSEQILSKLQELWPSGLKDTKYRWRGNMKDLTARFNAMIKERKLYDITEQQILLCGRLYVAQYDDDKRYMCVLPYFIYKQRNVAGKKVWYSKLADMLEELPKNDSMYDVPDNKPLDYGERLG